MATKKTVEQVTEVKKRLQPKVGNAVLVGDDREGTVIAITNKYYPDEVSRVKVRYNGFRFFNSAEWVDRYDVEIVVDSIGE